MKKQLTNEDLKKLIALELNDQFGRDLITIMSDNDLGAAARRVFSYLIYKGGVLSSAHTDYDNGKRHLALELIQACDSYGSPDPTAGLDIKHQAEKEYHVFQLKVGNKIRREMEGE